MRTKVGPFARANNSARACLTEMTRLGEPKCLYGDKLERLGGWPYHRKRVNRLGGVSHVNSSSSFVEKCIKSWLAQGSSGRRATLLVDVFLHIQLSEKMCTRQSRKVIWDMIKTLFLTTVAVEPTFVAFL